MSKIKCFLVEPTGFYNVFLRRYTISEVGVCPDSKNGFGHNAANWIERINEDKVNLDTHPHDDERWPLTCSCGYVFKDGDIWSCDSATEWQHAESGEIYQHLADAPVGAIWRATWYEDVPWLCGTDGKAYKGEPFTVMTNTHNFAQTELDILVKSSPTDDRPLVEPFIPEILALCEKFGLSGQSGGSAPYTATTLAQTIKKLCLQEPICPITGIDDEWVDVAYNDGQAFYQNNRCSAIFKEGKDGRAYYLDAIIFKPGNGSCFTGSAIVGNQVRVYSRQFIKSFPFIPKKFYIDVVEKEEEWYVKSQAKLKKVFKYYAAP